MLSWKWNEMHRALNHFGEQTCRLNWTRRTTWGRWDEWDALQTQDSKLKPWRSEVEHATSRSQRHPIILSFTSGWGRNITASCLKWRLQYTVWTEKIAAHTVNEPYTLHECFNFFSRAAPRRVASTSKVEFFSTPPPPHHAASHNDMMYDVTKPTCTYLFPLFSRAGPRHVVHSERGCTDGRIILYRRDTLKPMDHVWRAIV